MSDFNKEHFLSRLFDDVHRSFPGSVPVTPATAASSTPQMRENKLLQKKNICPPFGSPDVTRPKITTHACTHTSAYKQVPPPGGFSSPKYTFLLGYSLMREGGKKKKTSRVFAAARHSNRTRCTAFAACVALVITAASAGDSTRPRVYACMCVRVSRTLVPSGGIFELFYLLCGCCAFPPLW